MTTTLDDYRLPDQLPDYETAGPDLDAGLPANVDAERTILGAVLLDNAALKEIEQHIEPDDFSLDSHRRIFNCMVELYAGAHSVDLVTLANELTRRHEAARVGGLAYLASLTEGLPRRLVITEYLKIVRDKRIMRDLIGLSSAVLARVVGQFETGPEVIDTVKAQLAAIEQKIIYRDPDVVLVDAIDFAADQNGTVQWLVNGVIQKDGNGLIIADGKTGKSLLAIHLALHLASGTTWLGLEVPRRVSVALISREDDPGETARRIRSFTAGCPLRPGARVQDYLWLNTRAQTETFSLQNRRDLVQIIAALKRRKVEFAIFDVFRSMWSGDENDNSEVARVLESLRTIQREAGCAVCLLHHLSKGEGDIFLRTRGATAIHGWMEWGMGITIENLDDDEDKWVRMIRYRTKAARAHSKMYYHVTGNEAAMNIALTDPPKRKTKNSKTATEITAPSTKGYRDHDND